MIDYESLRKTVMETLKEVSMYSPGKIEQMLGEAYENSEESNLEAWERLTTDICQDRIYCKLLGVDYNNLPKEDMCKIYAFTLLLAKKDPSMILPII